MKQANFGLLTVAAFVASARLLLGQPAFEGRGNEKCVSDTSYLPVSVGAIVDTNHDSYVDAGFLVTQFQSEGKIFFEVVSYKVEVVNSALSQQPGAVDQLTRSRRIWDTSYIPLGLRQFVDVNGDTFVDSGTQMMEVQTPSETTYRAVKNLKYYDLNGVEVIVR